MGNYDNTQKTKQKRRPRRPQRSVTRHGFVSRLRLEAPSFVVRAPPRATRRSPSRTLAPPASTSTEMGAGGGHHLSLSFLLLLRSAGLRCNTCCGGARVTCPQRHSGERTNDIVKCFSPPQRRCERDEEGVICWNFSERSLIRPVVSVTVAR